MTAEYAKASPNDVLASYTVSNRGPYAARLHVLPTLWLRNVWSWGEECDVSVVLSVCVCVCVGGGVCVCVCVT